MNLLSIVWDVDPTIFSIGSFHLNYYSVLFLVGIYPIGYLLVRSFYKKEGLNPDLVDPLLWAILIGTVVGARLGHVFFYDWEYYSQHPEEIIMTWKGGLASHGGTVGVILGLAWYIWKYGKKNGIDLLWIMDRVAIATPFAACCIRLGNLFNSEIFGNPTDLPWGFEFVRSAEWQRKFNIDGVAQACHPTQIYEALVYLILGFILLFLYKKYMNKFNRGTLVGIFFTWVFGWRFVIEFIKEPQSEFEIGMFFNMGQILSIPFIIAGIALIIWSAKYGKPSMATMTYYREQEAKKKAASNRSAGGNHHN